MQPSPAAITYARQRLGWQVMAALLEAVAGPLAGEEHERAFVPGMRLVAVDGLCLDLPDTPENGAEFGYPGNGAGRGPFPQIRVVGLGECGTRAVLGAATSPLATGEQPLTRQLLARLRRGDLLAADRNFLSHGLLADVLAAGVHVLWRAKIATWTCQCWRCCRTGPGCRGSPTRPPPGGCAARAQARRTSPASPSA